MIHGDKYVIEQVLPPNGWYVAHYQSKPPFYCKHPLEAWLVVRDENGHRYLKGLDKTEHSNWDGTIDLPTEQNVTFCVHESVFTSPQEVLLLESRARQVVATTPGLVREAHACHGLHTPAAQQPEGVGVGEQES